LSACYVVFFGFLDLDFECFLLCFYDFLDGCFSIFFTSLGSWLASSSSSSDALPKSYLLTFFSLEGPKAAFSSLLSAALPKSSSLPTFFSSDGPPFAFISS
jgi:hypothetical protein